MVNAHKIHVKMLVVTLMRSVSKEIVLLIHVLLWYVLLAHVKMVFVLHLPLIYVKEYNAHQDLYANMEDVLKTLVSESIVYGDNARMGNVQQIHAWYQTFALLMWDVLMESVFSLKYAENHLTHAL